VHATVETNDARSVLDEARRCGVTLWIDDGQLRFRSPAGAMTAEMRGKISAHKPHIITLLLDTEHKAPMPPTLRARSRPELVPIIRHHHDRWADMLAKRNGVRFSCGPHFVTRVSGPLSVDVLTKSLQLLTVRHSILRARVVDAGSGPCFVYSPKAIVPTIIDLSTTPGGVTDERVQQVASDLVWQPFDLAVDPWFRAFVLKLGPTDHLFGFVIHHFIADARSIAISAQELFAIYGARIHGRASPLPRPPIQYHDYALAVNEWLDSDNVHRLEAFWRERLREAPATRIPPDADVHPDTVGQEKIAFFKLPDSLAEKLRAVTDCHTVRMHAHLAAALSAALAHCRGSADVLTLHRITGRSDPLLLDIVGAFFDTMAVRVKIDWEHTFAQCVELTQQSFLESYANSLYPFALVRRLFPQVGASGIAPLFNFTDGYDEPNPNDVEHTRARGLMPSLRKFDVLWHPLETHLARNHQGFNLELKHTARGFHAHIEYFEHRYTAETVDWFMHTFMRLLEAGVNDPTVPMRALVARLQPRYPSAFRG
jgi:hypothetical protein